MIQVVLRLSDGDRIETGSFSNEAEARVHAEELTRAIAAAEGWPLVGNRYVRPASIISVDVAEVREHRWIGSDTRLNWAKARSDPSEP